MSAHRDPGERKAAGRQARSEVPRSGHAEWAPPADRADPVELITGQDAERVPWLVPIRHARMAESPFAFYRGAARIMAADLASTPTSGLTAQLCGDAHLANFGTYASPDRRQVFDVNDFDETLPGPWEWDLKRLAASFVLAGKDNGFGDKKTRTVTKQAISGYREAMAGFAGSNTLDVWYWQMSLADIEASTPKSDRKEFSKAASKFRSKGSLRALSKLAEKVDGTYRIRSQPPLLLPLRDLADPADRDSLRTRVESSLAGYRSTLAENRRVLFDRFELVDIAMKVVGVGSVGTRCMVVLFQGRDENDPLFLQIKEASQSVLEEHLPASEYAEHGERVVRGQRLMQASSDIFLGWDTAPGAGHHYYWRQFHDMKGSADVEAMAPDRMARYAATCGRTLAHAHARSGDPVAIAGYLGSGDVFDRAVTEFAFRYAEQNSRDYEAFVEAIDTGLVEVSEG